MICKGVIQYLELFLILLFSCFCFKFSIAIDTITLTQPINDPETIISSNKAFQLGFFSPVNTTNRYVGIWYKNIPVRTVVWVANRDRPLIDSSGTLMISKDGNLVVLNGQKEIIWSSNVSNSMANSNTCLLDSGNLVLVDNSNGRTIWESFRYPSDSFLVKMVLSSDGSTGEKTLLKSWKSPSDPCVGSFSAGFSNSTIPEIFIWNGSRPYWRSGPWNGQIFIGVQYMTSLYDDGLNVVDNKEKTVSMSFSNANQSMLTYAYLNHEGALMEMGWTQGKEEPEVDWSAPETDCGVYGKCGSFGSCNSKDSPICSCLRGFGPNRIDEWISENFTGGCVRRTNLQCERNDSSSLENKKDGFLKLTTMKVPVFAEWSPVLANDCENQCLKNYKKRDMKLVNVISVIVGSIIISICAYFLWMGMVKQRGLKKKSDEMLPFKKLTPEYSMLEFPIFTFTYSTTHSTSPTSTSPHTPLHLTHYHLHYTHYHLHYTYYHIFFSILTPEYSTVMTFEDNLNQVKLEKLPLFKFEKLAIATDEFHKTNKLGQGGFGPVYKGKLLDGQEIAVKRLSRSSEQGLEEFMNEVVMISKLQHRNLVRLLGCCVEANEKVLVYEYMPNKSLDAFLFDPQKQKLLDWSKRFDIIEGIGRGLLYLHRDSRLRIIHRDLKASNILLDEELNPKISDFGMARVFCGDEHQANTRRVVGTYGYMAPEYAMQGRFSEKFDVFSFGVLLLEILSGRRNTSFCNDEQFLSLLEYAWKLWNEDNIVTLVDPMISYQYFRQDILRCVHVGLLCVQEFSVDRPTISTALSMLMSEISYLPTPKQPAFTQRLKRQSSQQSQSRCSRNELTITIVDGRSAQSMAAPDQPITEASMNISLAKCLELPQFNQFRTRRAGSDPISNHTPTVQSIADERYKKALRELESIREDLTFIKNASEQLKEYKAHFADEIETASKKFKSLEDEFNRTARISFGDTNRMDGIYKDISKFQKEVKKLKVQIADECHEKADRQLKSIETTLKELARLEVHFNPTNGISRLDTDKMVGICKDISEFQKKVTKLKLKIPSKHQNHSAANSDAYWNQSSNGSTHTAGQDSASKESSMPNLRKNETFGRSSEFKDFKALYDGLDITHKVCLLSFSVFPENEIISRRFMTYWWIGEGFVRPSPGNQKTAEASANEVFKQLVK
ncbi:hypothetical protein TEA_029782 [Camellia sinensis var. sinensis]|uniref:Non-specific serine/threonine protein kinase n=1 Tax=Camellia sinensis var. sinensis TaxID=542762 RepID=A0A4S4ELB4_CAMSN|nr:hypothetical protein TEA_029782 [Camellia sinensis var. sinensis]